MKPSALALVNLVVATVLLLTPFLVGLTASAPYDPWYDLDENGAIDIFDVVRIAGTYGTTGDPSMNVNVTNWPTTINVTLVGRANKLAYTILAQSVDPGGMYLSPWISIDGYSKVTVCVVTTAEYNSYLLETRHSDGGTSFYMEYTTNFPYHLVRTYDVPNEEIRIQYRNYDPGQQSVSIDIYVIP
jgi:hypothetical protein